MRTPQSECRPVRRIPLRAALLGLLFAAVAIGGCAGPDARGLAGLTEPSEAAVVPVKLARPVVALALGSGGARGFAHVGVIKALEAAGIQVDIVVGSSSGSIVAALYAGGFAASRLESIAVNLEESDLVDVSLLDGMRVRGERIAQFVRTSLDSRPIERLDRAFAVVATDAATGALTVFNRGDPGLAVRASSSIPRMFVPPVIAGREYIDGGLSSPVPVKLARAMGADVVIAVDVSRLADPRPSTAAGAPAATPYARSTRRQLLDAELAQADVVIRPDVPRTRVLDFERKLESIAAGESAARASLPQLDAALGSARQRREAGNVPRSSPQEVSR